tara:strand:+ start:35 stop:229 length:195 start_codon:yes stop_codon:yes gene_type:complete
MRYLTKLKPTASITANRDMTVMRSNANMMEGTSVTCQLRCKKFLLTPLSERLARMIGEPSRMSE